MSFLFLCAYLVTCLPIVIALIILVLASLEVRDGISLTAAIVAIVALAVQLTFLIPRLLI